MTSRIVQRHAYQRDPNSGAGNCWCGWPDLWGEFPPPIHGGPSWAERRVLWRREPKGSGLERAALQLRDASGLYSNGPSIPIRWDGA